MLTIKVVTNKILISKKENNFLVFTFTQFINEYLNGEFENEIETFLENYYGTTFLKRLKILKNYKKLNSTELSQVTKTKKLGTGSYATVYQYSPKIAIKVIEKDSTETYGIETKINKLLQESILFGKMSPCINMIYQEKSEKKFDYIAIEKGDLSLWHWVDSASLNDLKGVIFQIIFTLAVIQREYPNFRHNDLKCDNIILSLKNEEPIYLKLGDSIWKINSPLAKITDFDYSNIKGLIDNPKVGTSFCKGFGCTSTPSKIYDLHLFLNSLYNKVNTKVKEWIETIIPNKFLGDTKELSYSRLKFPESREATKIKTPEMLINDPFFDCFKVKREYKKSWGK